LIQQPTIKAQSVVAVGHSRFGKVAMLAGATDARIDAVIAHQAGAGGTSPLRSSDPGAEKPSHLAASFPHWFTPAFAALAEDPERAPFDQHTLLSLAAPRPVLLSNAVEDAWADPVGQLAVRAAAEPVYAVVDPGYEPFEQPAQEGLLPAGTHLHGRVEWSLREGSHSVSAEDWQGFLDFVQRQVPAAPPAARP
jgi:(4-O-methyl)-D-glucuronate---lignin esterase